MALYLHRFEGILPIGTSWGVGWWSDSTATLAQMQTAAEQWLDDFWTVDLAALYSTGFTIARVATSLINQSDGKQINLAETTVTEAGTGVTASCSADMAVVVSLRTDTTARVGRGRFYFPGGLTSQIVTTGRVNSTTVTELTDALTAAWAVYIPTGQPVIYSRTDRLTREITRFDIGDLWDTQRRRENKAVEVRVSTDMPA